MHQCRRPTYKPVFYEYLYNIIRVKIRDICKVNNNNNN